MRTFRPVSSCSGSSGGSAISTSPVPASCWRRCTPGDPPSGRRPGGAGRRLLLRLPWPAGRRAPPALGHARRPSRGQGPRPRTPAEVGSEGRGAPPRARADHLELRPTPGRKRPSQPSSSWRHRNGDPAGPLRNDELEVAPRPSDGPSCGAMGASEPERKGALGWAGAAPGRPPPGCTAHQRGLVGGGPAGLLATSPRTRRGDAPLRGPGGLE